MAVDEVKLQQFTLDEFLDAWEADGLPIPKTKRAWPAYDEQAAPHPDAMDRLTAGPQHAFIRTFEALLASRWRSAVGEMRETPAEDDTYRPAGLAILNDFGVRLFRKSAPKRERVRFQDHIILQRTDNTFVNYVECIFTTEATITGDAIFQVRVREGTDSGAWEAPVSATLSHDGAQKFYTLKFDIGPRALGTLLSIEIYRDKDSAGDTLADDVGLIAARLV